jgi:hypothetical protein
MAKKLRYNCEFANAEEGIETSHNWLTLAGVATLLRKLDDGDDLVIHCVEDTSGKDL